MEAEYYEKLTGKKVRCILCPRNCIITTGKKGACGVRKNQEGTLITEVYNKPCTIAIDPIEKKPLYHFHPGEKILSIATVGCNLFCKWCQNHEISHPEGKIINPYGEITAKEIIRIAEEEKTKLIAFTYTEPTIYYEYMKEIAKEAKKKNMKTVIVSNGYINQEPLKELLPLIDAANIDLKVFNEKKHLLWTSAELKPILETIKTIKKSNTWLELTTLIVPGVVEEHLEEEFEWIRKELGEEQVIHLSRFYPDYKTTDKEPTPIETLMKAREQAKKKLKYVYVGNIIPTKETHNTTCPECGETIIKRTTRIEIRLKKNQCPRCGTKIPGVWE